MAPGARVLPGVPIPLLVEQRAGGVVCSQTHGGVRVATAVHSPSQPFLHSQTFGAWIGWYLGQKAEGGGGGGFAASGSGAGAMWNVSMPSSSSSSGSDIG